VGSGPGSSPVGWTSLGSVPATQGATASGISLPIDIPDIPLTVGQVTGVAVKFTGVGPRYFGTGTPALSVYSDANLSLTTGDVRTIPFTTGGSFFSSRALVGSLTYTLAAPPTVYCTAKLTSNGCTPAIAFSGTPSATAGSGFVVSASNVRNNKNGLLVYGNSGASALPFQGGTMCVNPPTRRAPYQNSYGSHPTLPPDCTGTYSIDMNAFAVGALGGTPTPWLATPGSVINCQWWGRDPGFAVPDASMLTDGLEYTVGI